MGRSPDVGALKRMCYICHATPGGVNTCLSIDAAAAWRGTLSLNHAAYMDELRLRGYISELWNMPGVQHSMLVLGNMHIS